MATCPREVVKLEHSESFSTCSLKKWCGHALCRRRGTGMASRFLEGRAGYLLPRLALAFSQGGSITMQS